MDTIHFQDQVIQSRSDRSEFQRWVAERRSDSPEEQFAEMAALLSPLFQYLADGRARGNLEMRAWLVLYALYPHLLEGETMAEFAKKTGVQQSALSFHLDRLRHYVPGLSVDTLSRCGCARDKDTARHNRSVARRRYRYA